jgi:radical SAM protein with 4Fe4S-binding SPASM domain
MKRKGSMPTHRIIELLYNYAHKVSDICPFGMQEPLLEPRLAMILANIKQLNPNCKTTLYSNLGIYPEQTLTEIVKWGLLDKIEVSFYGTNKETYAYMQPPLNYETTKDNIHKLMALKKRLHRTKPEVELMMLKTAYTLDGLKEYVEEWTPIVDKVAGVHFDSWCGTHPYSPELEKELWNDPGQTERVPCPRLWGSMYIHYDGTVVPCCLDSDELEPCGNIFEDKESWFNNPRLNELRMLHQQRQYDKIPLCKDCVTWRYGCDQEWNDFWMNKPLTVSSAKKICIPSI